MAGNFQQRFGQRTVPSNVSQRFGSGSTFPRRFPASSQNPRPSGVLSQNTHPQPNYQPNSEGPVIGGMNRLGIFAQFDSSSADTAAQIAKSEQSKSRTNGAASASAYSNTDASVTQSGNYVNSGSFSQTNVMPSISGPQIVKSKPNESEGCETDTRTGSENADNIEPSPKKTKKKLRGSKQLSNKELQDLGRGKDLIKGSKTGMSLNDFLNKSNKAKKPGGTGPSVPISKVSLSEFIWDRDGGKSWDEIKEKFGLTNDESGFHMIKMDQSKSDETSGQTKTDGKKTDQSQSDETSDQSKSDKTETKTDQSKENTTKTKQDKTRLNKSSHPKSNVIKTRQSKSDVTKITQSEGGIRKNVTQTGQSAVKADEISLSDFIWDHESGKSWESIKKKFGLESDESVILPVVTDQLKSDRAKIGDKKRGASETDTNRSRGSAPLKRGAVDSRQSKAGTTKPKLLKTTHSATDHENLNAYDTIPGNLDPASSNSQSGSREPLKRKSCPEKGDAAKRQRMSMSSAVQGSGNIGKPNPKIIIGNVFVGVKKDIIDRMFESVPGIVSWSLRRHKTSLANTCIMVEMASDMAAVKFKEKFKGTTICNRQVCVRNCNLSDEAMYEPDQAIRSDSFSPQPETEPQTDNKKKIFLGNLPADVQKYQIDQLVRFIHGVMSYRLRQHKDKKNDLAVIVEMAYEIASSNLLRVVTGSEIDGCKITCRYCRPEDEEIYTGEGRNTWEEVRIQKEQKTKKAVVFIGNLPSDSSKDDLKDYISDLMYKSVDFHAGEHTAHKTLKPSYAYVHFNNDDDAKKMMTELHGGLFFGNIINVKLEYREVETEKPAAPKQKEVPSLLDIRTKPPVSTSLTTEQPAGGLDTGSSSGSAGTKKPAGNTDTGHADSGTIFPTVNAYTSSTDLGNIYTSSAYSGMRIPAGNTYTGSTDSGTIIAAWNARIPAGNTDSTVGNTDTGTATPAGSTGLDLLGSAYGLDMLDEIRGLQAEQPAGYSDQNSMMPSGPGTRRAPWSKYMNWTQTDTQDQNTVVQSEQAGNNIGHAAGILKNTPAGMLGKRNAAGYMDYIPKDLPNTRQVVEKNRNQWQTDLVSDTDIKASSTARSAGLRPPAGGRTRQPVGILKKRSSLNMRNNVPAGSNENSPNMSTGNNALRSRLVGGVTAVRINTPSGIGILYGTTDERARTTAPEIGGRSSRPAEKGNLQVSSSDGYRPTSIKALEGYLSGYHSAACSKSSSSSSSRASSSLSDSSSSDSSPVPGPVRALREASEEGRTDNGTWLEQYLKETAPIPVIGLDYVTEYSMPYQSYASYKCALCDAFPQGVGIVTHLGSHKHRLNYMERRLPTLFKKVEALSLKMSDLSSELTKHAKEIERRNGRGKMTLIAEEQELQRKIAEEQERQRKIAEEQERQRKIAGEQERQRQIAEEEEKQRQIAEEEERLRMIAEELERQRKILEEQESYRKKAEEKERQRKIMEEKERQRKVAEEKERQRKIVEEKEKQRKIAEEKERQRKIAEEKERQRKISEEKERQRKIVEEQERQRKIAEELQAKIEERKREEAEKLWLKKEAEKRELEKMKEERERALALERVEKERQEMEQKKEKELQQKREMERHRKQSEVTKESSPNTEPTSQTAVENTEVIIKQLEQERKPILGLDYITYQPNEVKPKMPFYKCSLCEITSYMTLLVKHVTSYSHLMAYFKKHALDVHQWIHFQRTRAKQVQQAQEKARELEKRCGRGTLNFSGLESAKSTLEPTIPEKDQGSTQVQDMEIDSESEETGETELNLLDTTGNVNLRPLDPDSSKAKLFDMVKEKDDSPLVGLRYITEIQSGNRLDSLKYKCQLCSTEVSKGLILIHLKGHRHKMAYIRENYPDTFSHVQDKGVRAEEFCRYIERQKGKEPINVVKMIAPKTPDDPVTYSKPVRVRPPGKYTEDERKSQTPTSPVTLERQTPTPPFRVITPPLSIITPVRVVTSPPVITTPTIIPVPVVTLPPAAAVPTFLAKNLAINVKSVTMNSNNKTNELGQGSTSVQEVTMRSFSEMQGQPPPQPPPMMFSPFVPPPTIVPTMVRPPTLVPPPMMRPPPMRFPPPNMQVPPTSMTSQPTTEEKNKQDQESTDTGIKVRKMKNFYDLLNEYRQKPFSQKKILLGLSYITEIQHPYDKEPPLFQCDVCRHSCIAKEIIPHIVAKSHQLKFFKREYPILYTVIVANFPKAQNDSLNMYTKQIESTHRQERIRRVIAKDDLPWKTWKNNTVTGRYMKTEGTIEDGIELEPSYEIEGDASFDGRPQDMDKPLDFNNQTSIASTSRPSVSSMADTGVFSMGDTGVFSMGDTGVFSMADTGVFSMGDTGVFSMGDTGVFSTSDTGASNMADKPLQFDVKKASVPAVNVKQGVAMSDIVAEEEIDETKWEAVNAEIERRIENKSVILVEKASKFLKTYKPFLDKFPVIGLEGLTEFQKPDQDIDPWYLCYLCHMEVDWKDIVDHVVTLLHRTKYIEKEHPKLHELLTTSFFESRNELKEKIEEFSKGVAKPPTDFTVKVMLELAITQEQLDLALKAPKEERSEMKKPEQAKQEPGQTDREPERTLEQQRKQPRIVFHHNHGKPGPVTPAPIVKDYQHGSLIKTTATDKEESKDYCHQSLPAGVATDKDKCKDYYHKSLPKATAADKENTQDYHHQSLRKATATEKEQSEVLKPRFPELFGGKTKRAIVGLDHVSEYQSVDHSSELHYVCGLCDAKLGTGTIMQHLMSQKHRFTFFSKYLPDVYNKLTGKSTDRPMSRSEVNTLTEQYALEYEQEHGRSEVQVVLGRPEEERDRTMKGAMRVKVEDERLKKTSETDLPSHIQVSAPLQTSGQSYSVGSNSVSQIQGPSNVHLVSDVQYPVQSVSRAFSQSGHFQSQQQAATIQTPVHPGQIQHQPRVQSCTTLNFSSSQPVHNRSYSMAFIPSSSHVTNITHQLPVSAHQVPIQIPVVNQQVPQPQIQHHQYLQQHQKLQEQQLQQKQQQQQVQHLREMQQQHQLQLQQLEQQKLQQQHQQHQHLLGQVQQPKPMSDFDHLVQKQLEMLKQQELEKQMKEQQQRLAFQLQPQQIPPTNQPQVQPNFATAPWQHSQQNVQVPPQNIIGSHAQPPVHLPEAGIQGPVPLEPVLQIVPTNMQHLVGQPVVQVSQSMPQQQINQQILTHQNYVLPEQQEIVIQPFVQGPGFSNIVQPGMLPHPQMIRPPIPQPSLVNMSVSQSVIPNVSMAISLPSNLRNSQASVQPVPHSVNNQQSNILPTSSESYNEYLKTAAEIKAKMQAEKVLKEASKDAAQNKQSDDSKDTKVAKPKKSLKLPVVPLLRRCVRNVLTTNGKSGIPKTGSDYEHECKDSQKMSGDTERFLDRSRSRRSLSNERDPSSKVLRPKRAQSADRERRASKHSDTRKSDNERTVTRIKTHSKLDRVKSPEVDAEFDARNYRNTKFADAILAESSKKINEGKRKDKNKDLIEISSSESEFEDIADEFDAYKYRGLVEKSETETLKDEKSVEGTAKDAKKKRLTKHALLKDKKEANATNVSKGIPEKINDWLKADDQLIAAKHIVKDEDNSTHGQYDEGTSKTRLPDVVEELDATKYIGIDFNKQSETLEKKTSDTDISWTKYTEQRYRKEHEKSPHKADKQFHSKDDDPRTNYLGKEFDKHFLENSPAKKSLQIVKSGGKVKAFDDFSVTITQTKKSADMIQEKVEDGTSGDRLVYSHSNNITIKATSSSKDEHIGRHIDKVRERIQKELEQWDADDSIDRSQRESTNETLSQTSSHSDRLARMDTDISEVRKRIQRELEKCDSDASFLKSRKDDRRVVRISPGSNRPSSKQRQEGTLPEDRFVYKVEKYDDVKSRQRSKQEKYFDRELELSEARKRIQEELAKLDAEQSSSERYVSRSHKHGDKGHKKHSKSKTVLKIHKDDLEDVSDESDEWPNDEKKLGNKSNATLQSSEFETIDSDSEGEVESSERIQQNIKGAIKSADLKERSNKIKPITSQAGDEITKYRQEISKILKEGESDKGQTSEKTEKESVKVSETEKGEHVKSENKDVYSKDIKTRYNFVEHSENIPKEGEPENVTVNEKENNKDPDSETEEALDTNYDDVSMEEETDNEYEDVHELNKTDETEGMAEVSENEDEYSEVIDYVGNEMVTIDMIEEGSTERENNREIKHNVFVSETEFINKAVEGMTVPSTTTMKYSDGEVSNNSNTENEKKTPLFDSKHPKYGLLACEEREKIADSGSVFDNKQPKYGLLETEEDKKNEETVSPFDNKHPKYGLLEIEENLPEEDQESSRHSSQYSGDSDFQAMMASRGDNFVTVDDLDQNRKEERGGIVNDNIDMNKEKTFGYEKFVTVDEYEKEEDRGSKDFHALDEFGDEILKESENENFVTVDVVEDDNWENNNGGEFDVENFVTVANLETDNAHIGKSLETDMIEASNADFGEFVTVDDAQIDNEENVHFHLETDSVEETDNYVAGNDGDEDKFIELDEFKDDSDFGSDNVGDFMNVGDGDFVDVDEYRENSESENKGDNINVGEIMTFDEVENIDDKTRRTITVHKILGKETSDSRKGSYGAHSRKEMHSQRMRNEYGHGERAETTRKGQSQWTKQITDNYGILKLEQTAGRLSDTSTQRKTSTRRNVGTELSMKYLGMPVQRHRDEGRREGEQYSSRSYSRTKSPGSHIPGTRLQPSHSETRSQRERYRSEASYRGEKSSKASHTSENRPQHYHEPNRSHHSNGESRSKACSSPDKRSHYYPRDSGSLSYSGEDRAHTQ